MKFNCHIVSLFAAIALSATFVGCATEGDCDGCRETEAKVSAASAYEPAPSRAWVRMYVNEAVSNSTASLEADAKVTTTNKTTYTDYVVNGIPITLSWENWTERAVVAADETPGSALSGVTNGTTWAIDHDTGNYKSKSVQPIYDNGTNYTFMSWITYQSEGKTWFFDGTNKMFSITFKMITPSEAREIKGE